MIVPRYLGALNSAAVRTVFAAPKESGPGDRGRDARPEPRRVTAWGQPVATVTRRATGGGSGHPSVVRGREAVESKRRAALERELARRTARPAGGATDRPTEIPFVPVAWRTRTERDPETRGEAAVGLGPMTAAEAAATQAAEQDFSTPVYESASGTGIREDGKAMSEQVNVKVGPEKARLMFATWVKKRHPALYEKAFKETVATEVSGIGEAQETGKSFWQKVTESLTSLGTGYLTYKNQKDMLELNIKRAEQGLPPLDAGATAPVVRTQIDVEPEIADRLSAGIGAGLQKSLLIGGAALAAILLLKKK